MISVLNTKIWTEYWTCKKIKLPNSKWTHKANNHQKWSPNRSSSSKQETSLREKFVESSLMLHSARQSSSSWHHGSLSLPSVLGVRSVHRVLSPYIRSQYSLSLFSHCSLTKFSFTMLTVLLLCPQSESFTQEPLVVHEQHRAKAIRKERRTEEGVRRGRCSGDAASTSRLPRVSAQRTMH